LLHSQSPIGNKIARLSTSQLQYISMFELASGSVEHNRCDRTAERSFEFGNSDQTVSFRGKLD